MSNALRNKLSHLNHQGAAHAGLLLDRYLKSHKEMDPTWDKKGPTPEEQLLNAITEVAASESYKSAFRSWKDCILATADCVLETATLASPLAIGLGNDSPLEVGLTIHHTYGMPVIPGSAVKGLCRAACRAAGLITLDDKGNDVLDEKMKALFGDQTSAGCAVFYDAWYDSESVGGKPFHRDVITVHHQKYYGSRGKDAWPTDFDDPTPVPFLVVRPGAQFLFRIERPNPEWHGFVRNMLEHALTEIGVGAKTNAGYGRFEQFPEPPPPPPVTTEETWTGITVQRNPSPLGFNIASPNDGMIKIDGKQADEFNRKFTIEFRDWLKKRQNKFTSDIVVLRIGDRVDVIAINPTEGPQT